jgi:hypothetical protein
VNGKEDMRGQRHSREGTFDFGGRKHYFDIKALYFSSFEFGGLLQGSIGCWEFWAQGPGILTES